MSAIQLTGFMPDLDPAMPGIITDCSMMVPTVRGYKGSPSAIAIGLDALASDCRGSAYVMKLDGSGRFFAGTQTKLFEGTGGSGAWVDVSAVGSYTGSSESRWRFAQFGDSTYATNKSDVLQVSAGSGAFVADAGGIKASYVEVVAGFIMLADTSEATYGDQSDRWWCSPYLGTFTGIPSVTTQETTGRLVDIPGPIKAIRKLGSNIVVYKNRGLWLGQYVSAPAVWQFQLIPGEIGCDSQEAVVDIGSEHVFLGYENFYRFDGSRPVPIGDQIKKWFFADLSQKYRYKVIGSHDRKNSLVRFYYPSKAGNGIVDSCVVYNYQNGKWGRENRTIESAVEFLTGQLTYDNLGTYFATYDDLPNISYDSSFFNESSPSPTVFESDHKPYSLVGVSLTSSLTTGDMGDSYQYSLLQRMRARFASSPASATMTNSYNEVEGDPMVVDATVTMDDGKFDVLRSARWHRVEFGFTGDVEMLSYDAAIKPDGFA
jgi:hypothetical protein